MVSESFSGEAEVAAKVRFRFYQKPVLRIFPDDKLVSMTVNDWPVDLSGFSDDELGDWRNGFLIDISKYAHEGYNSIKFILHNSGGHGGISILPAGTGIYAVAGWIFLLTGAALGFMVLSRKFGLTSEQCLIGIASLAIICIYWVKTPFNVRQFDIFEGGGHLDYIRFVYENWKLPPSGGGWEYHQPPLYYISALPTLFISKYFPAVGWEGLLRALSLGYWMTFVAASLAIAKHYLQANTKAICLASFAICFWPSGIIHAIRVGNDIPFFALYSISLYATCLWWSKGDDRQFLWACAVSVLAALTKSNGLAMFGVLAALLSIRCLRFRLGKGCAANSALWKNFAILGVSGLIVFFFSFGKKLWLYWTGETRDWLLSNVSSLINPGLGVSNRWFNYLNFDIQKLVSQPWMSSWHDETGRQYFWNYLFRSSLTSEFSFVSREIRTMAIFAGIILLVLLFHVFRRIFSSVSKAVVTGQVMGWRNVYRSLPLVLSAVFLLCLLLAYRIKIPMSCNTDFRYVYPVLISVVIGELGLQRFRGSCPKTLYVAAPLVAVFGATFVFWL